MSDLTPKQTNILAFLRTFHAEEDRLPSTREIQAHFRIESQTVVVGHLRALCKKGELERRTSATGNRHWYRFKRNLP